MRQDSVDELAGHLGGVLGMVVEGGDYGEDGGSGVGGELHVAKVDAVQRGLSDTEEQGTALLEADVGGALDEVRGETVGDGGESPHGAGQDDHGIGEVTAAGDVGCDVGVCVLLQFGARGVEELFGEAVAAA